MPPKKSYCDLFNNFHYIITTDNIFIVTEDAPDDHADII